MKAAHVRIEITKGDVSKDIPWVRMERIVQRDRSIVCASEAFKTRAEMKLRLLSLADRP